MLSTAIVILSALCLLLSVIVWRLKAELDVAERDYLEADERSRQHEAVSRELAADIEDLKDELDEFDLALTPGDSNAQQVSPNPVSSLH